MTRNGKVARLPRYLREQLNRRLNDGQPGPPLLAWLNGRPDVQAILERDFGGRAINEQNLSDWRQGGFRDWERQQQACDHVRRLSDQAEALHEAAEATSVGDRLATVLAVELFKTLEQLLAQGVDDKERLGYLREGLREVRLLRRSDHHAARLKMEQERWERHQEQEDEAEIERLEAKSKSRLMALVFSKLHEANHAELFGGGEHGRKVAEMITRIKFDMPLDDLPQANNAGKSAATNGAAEGPRTEAAATQTTQGQSRPIKVNQGESSHFSFQAELPAACYHTSLGTTPAVKTRQEQPRTPGGEDRTLAKAFSGETLPGFQFGKSAIVAGCGLPLNFRRPEVERPEKQK
jgi:hypothetical protein